LREPGDRRGDLPVRRPLPGAAAAGAGYGLQVTDRVLPRRLRRALARHGVLRSPSLQTDRERTASRLELFFDLAFVLVVAELAGRLRADVSVHGVLVFTRLFTVVWWSWVSSTLYANRFDHDDVAYRLLKLGGMAAVIGLAAAAPAATGARLPVFAGCAAALRALLLLQYLRVHRHVPQARPVVRLYAGTIAAGTLLWAVSPVVPRPGCFMLWCWRWRSRGAHRCAPPGWGPTCRCTWSTCPSGSPCS
jgi:Bacterial low temperature requirement A protein (LtrA)